MQVTFDEHNQIIHFKSKYDFKIVKIENPLATKLSYDWNLEADEDQYLTHRMEYLKDVVTSFANYTELEEEEIRKITFQELWNLIEKKQKMNNKPKITNSTITFPEFIIVCDNYTWRFEDFDSDIKPENDDENDEFEQSCILIVQEYTGISYEEFKDYNFSQLKKAIESI